VKEQMPSQQTMWPLSGDYVEAIQNPRNCFVDVDLLDLVPAVDRLGMPTVSSGQFAYVFKLNRISSNESLAARCFRGFAAERDKRYNAIDDHLDHHKLGALASFDYESSGIRVNGSIYPLLVMEWVDGPTLDVYLDEVMGKREIILHLADQWLKLVKNLGEAQIAHGDLQHGNIIVQNGGLRLVDFDGMYVPSMKGWNALELGHRHYQHPLRDAFFFDNRLDNFSALLIHLSLIAVADNPQLWKEFHDENLIFKKDDFLKPSQSPLFRKVKAMGGEVQRLSTLLEKACMESVAACPNLSDLAAPKSKLPAWMTVPIGTPVQTRTREVSPGTIPKIGIPVASAPAQTPSQAQPATWQPPHPSAAQPTVSPTDWGKVIGQGLGQAVGVFILSLIIYWLWLPVLTAIYTGMGAVDADAQGYSWFSDIIICLGIGIYRAKKQESNRVKPWSRPSAPTVSIPSPRTSSHPRWSTPRTSGPQILNAPIVGSSIRHIYHRASCDWARKISARNRVTFGSVSDAQARGYRRCRVCLP
jgi:hypothetical protein